MKDLQLRTFSHVLMSVHDAGLIGVTLEELQVSFETSVLRKSDDHQLAGRIFANTKAWMRSQGLIADLPGNVLCITRGGLNAMAIRVNDGNNELISLSGLCTAVLDGTSKAADSDILGIMALKS
jgi:hypothetical protein